MGVVFRASDREAGRTVAVKSVRGAGAAFERFAHEAAVLASLDHPRIVRYVAHGSTENGRYLVMEWLDGEDLARRLLRGCLTLSETLRVVQGLAEALAELHARGIVHRDIKPGNTFLVEGAIDRTKLLDLGIARAPALGWSLTGTGTAIGTPAYMAPEQARGEAVDPRADVFSLGCLFFECLTGRSPFYASHPIAALARILVDDPPRLGDCGIAVPEAVEVLLATLLAKDRAGRPADGAEVLVALARIFEESSREAETTLSSLTSAERRVVSIVLSRSVSATDATMCSGDSNELDHRVRRTAARHGAHIERLANGSYLALFSGVGVPSDDAARAATFALELAAILVGDAISLSTGRAQFTGRLPVGEVIDLAVASLVQQQVGVQVDAASAVLLGDRFEVASDGATHWLLGPREILDVRRTLLGQATPCVGRERELAAMRTVFSTCIAEPVASTLLITAPPGTGKSRVVAEWVRELHARPDVACVLFASCDVMNAGSAFGLAGRIIRHAMRGAAEGAPWDQILERMRLRLATRDVERVAEMLAEICGLARTDADVSPYLRERRSDPGLLGDAIEDAWCTWLAAECAAGPVLLVLEDLHWGDWASFKLIDEALRSLADQPLCVLATARPQVHALFARLWADHGVQEIRLGNLPHKHAERLTRQCIGNAVSEDILQRIVQRAAGHPFFLEELIRAAVAGSTLNEELPDSVLGMLEARFVGLDESARSVLRAASVFGETFWLGGVRALLGGTSVESALDDLTLGEFVQRRPESKFAGLPAYTFRHSLVRDAAYAMITTADLITGHRLAGRWLVEVGERDALVLAEHFDRGGLPMQAGGWYQRAAEDALAGDDLPGAIRLATRALACDPGPQERGELELILAEAMIWSGDRTSGLRHALAAVGRFPEGTDRWFGAVGFTINGTDLIGRPDLQLLVDRVMAATTIPTSDAQLICLARAIDSFSFVSQRRLAPLIDRLAALADSVNPGPLAQGFLANARANSLPERWRQAAAWSRAMLHAQQAFEQAGALRYASQCHVVRAIHLSAAGRSDEALPMLEDAIAAFERRKVKHLMVFARYGYFLALFFSGRDEACMQVLAAARTHLPASLSAHYDSVICAGVIAFDAGDFSTAEALARSICRLDRFPDSHTPSAHGLLARALVGLRRFDEALLAGEEAVARDDGERVDKWIELATIGLAEARLALGDVARARASVNAAWTDALNIPLTDEQRRDYTQRRIVRDLAALAQRFGIE